MRSPGAGPTFSAPITRAGSLIVLALVFATPLAWSYTYQPANLAAVTAATVALLLVCLGWRRLRPGPAGWVTLALTGLVAAIAVWRWQPLPNVTTTGWFGPSVWLTVVAGLLLGGSVVLSRVAGRDQSAEAGSNAVARCAGPAAGVALLAGLVLGGVGAVLAVPGGVRPEIDVWILLQDAAHGVLGGHNPYAMSFPAVPAGQTATCFTYLPGSFLLVIPGRLVGDVRIAEAAFFVLPWVVLFGRSLHRLVHRPTAERFAAVAPVVLALVLPATLRVMQQSWTDSLLIGLLTTAVICWRSAWVVVPLGLALATKQHALLMLPLLPLWLGWRRSLGAAGVAAAVGLPFLLADPGRFMTCTVTFFLDLPITGTSVSLWTVLPAALRSPVLVFAFLVVAYAVSWRALPRGRGTFPIALALVLCAFNLTNKQSYVNQWWLVAELLLLGAVSTTVTAVTGEDVPIGDGDRGRLGPVLSTPCAPERTAPGVSRRALLAVASGGVLVGCTDPHASTPDASTPPKPTINGTAPASPASPPDRGLIALADKVLADLLGHALAVSALPLRSRANRLAQALRRQRTALAGLARRPVPADPAKAPTTGAPSATAQATRLAARLTAGARDLTALAAKAESGDTAALLASAAAGLSAAWWTISPVGRRRVQDAR